MRDGALVTGLRGERHWAHSLCSLHAAGLTLHDLAPQFDSFAERSFNLHLLSRFFDEAPPEHVESFDSTHSMNP